MTENKHEAKHKAQEEKIAEAMEETKKEISEEKPKAESKKETKKTEKPKRTEAVIRVSNLSVSTKKAAGICKFIKGKTISKAVRDLEEVIKLRRPIPMRGEYAHRKGKGMSSGKYPIRASKNFIILLKSLAANASDINEPIIVKAVANIGVRPYGRFGRIRRKRTHIEIVAKEKKLMEAKK